MSANPLLSAIGRSEVEIIVRKASVNPPDNIADAADGTVSVAVTDVEIGDIVLVAPPYDGQAFQIGAIPSAANTVDVTFYNASGGQVNLATATYTFLIFKTSSQT